MLVDPFMGQLTEKFTVTSVQWLNHIYKLMGDQNSQKFRVSMGDQIFVLNGGCQWVTKICSLKRLEVT